MAIVGDARQFSDLFDSLVPSILDLVLSTWNIFRKPCASDLEVPINRRFCEALRQEKNRRDEVPLKIHSELPLLHPDTGEETGRIDLYLDPTYMKREEVYFAFECKRLRVPYDSRIRTYAAEYVGEKGMMRFVREQYSRDLPCGGMIGYVMDSKIGLAIGSVRKAIHRRHKELCLIPEMSLAPSSVLPSESAVKETRHELRSREFHIHHVFLTCDS